MVPPSSAIRTRTGLVVRHREISSGDVVSVRGLRALSLPLTLADLCVQKPAIEALVVIDMAVQRRLADPIVLARYAEAASGRPGMRWLHSLALMAAPAESPMETRLRYLLVEGGLPQPEVQTNLYDAAARFVGRADLYYPDARLALEYDGGNHRDGLIEDDRRQNLLVNAGYRLLRFTAADVQGRPEAVVAQVRAALGPKFVRSTRKARFPRPKESVLRKTHRIVTAAVATARSGSGSAGTRR